MTKVPQGPTRIKRVLRTAFFKYLFCLGYKSPSKVVLFQNMTLRAIFVTNQQNLLRREQTSLVFTTHTHDFKCEKSSRFEGKVVL